MSEPGNPAEEDRKQHLAEITEAVEAAIHRLDERDKAANAAEKLKAEHKEALSTRVSVAALALTMLLSFLGFAHGERDDAAKDARRIADGAKRDSEDNWQLYQARSSERANYVIAADALTREAQTLAAGDPRQRLLALNHVEYATRITQVDNESRHLFFIIQKLQRTRIQKLREADHIDAQIARYDMGTRVLTLALVILSVTLLANQERLFWVAVLTSFAGAGVSISGYFLG
jgi:hypothetical protein